MVMMADRTLLLGGIERRRALERVGRDVDVVLDFRQLDLDLLAQRPSASP